MRQRVVGVRVAAVLGDQERGLERVGERGHDLLDAPPPSEPSPLYGCSGTLTALPARVAARRVSSAKPRARE